jgi:hypothetical protein
LCSFLKRFANYFFLEIEKHTAGGGKIWRLMLKSIQAEKESMFQRLRIRLWPNHKAVLIISSTVCDDNMHVGG